ncbi:MAG: amidohydrolase [Clostridia bacterium]|nr:amidohydrolase [Clostridia bacterium]
MNADIIIKGTHIYDGISDEPFPGFIAVTGNRISCVHKSVGIDSNDASFIEDIHDSHTQIINAGDRLVTAGFHDSHTHLTLAGMYRTCVNLGNAKSEEETARMVYDFNGGADGVKAVPADAWIYGFNWLHLFWDVKELPHKRTLDKYFPDRPVMLLNSEAHACWVNSRALDLAGITDETPDPFGGHIERDPEGHATGVLHDGAMNYCVKLAYEFSMEQEKEYLRSFMKSAAQLGITAVVNVAPYFGKEMGSLQVYSEMEKDGELTTRITLCQDLLGDLDEALEKSRTYRTEFVRAHMLKSFVDGVFPVHTALMLEDYADDPGNKGKPLFNLDATHDAILEAQKRGLWVKLHAIGDRAIRFALDCFQEAREVYGDTGCRHAIEHLELVDPADIPRFGELHVTPSVQPEHVGLLPTIEDEVYYDILGTERAERTWAFKDLQASAGYLAMGSDCPVVDNNPLCGISRGMTRVHNDGLPKGGWNPTQKLTLAELIRGYTYGSAYGAGWEDDLGTLETGKLADILILDRNLFETTPEEIRNAHVDMTIMNGRVIYAR